ncbi:uncharacterized protein LOC123316241 isoform X6 [Coccinella septempunctata]|uniref:uncharacterized protein LOC123316241 isoform X6 n=1 Tax=Coccinella septempunctata TaxID=41139 RepID=UPI001D0943EC|nr:uncharacterized protein LOC123316241 isoform X6 [Coccinella septempunctata]
MKVLYFLLIFLLAYAAATQALPSHQTSDGADMDGTVESVDEVRAKRGFDDRESSSLRDKREENSVFDKASEYAKKMEKQLMDAATVARNTLSSFLGGSKLKA